MSDEDQYRRMLDKESVPTEKQIMKTIGADSVKHWKELRKFLDQNYNFEPELDFLGKKYGWAYKYRRKGKTLCTLFPETGAFTVLITLGKKEVEEVNNKLQDFNEETRRLYNETPQYHDGKWLYKRILGKSDVQDAILLITAKKKPG